MAWIHMRTIASIINCKIRARGIANRFREAPPEQSEISGRRASPGFGFYGPGGRPCPAKSNAPRASSMTWPVSDPPDDNEDHGQADEKADHRAEDDEERPVLLLEQGDERGHEGGDAQGRGADVGYA